MNRVIKSRSMSATPWMLPDHLLFLVLVWALFTAAVGLIIAGIAIFGDITNSVWEQAATQVTRWFMLFIGVHLGYSLLPLYVAHGQTRKQFASVSTVFVTFYTLTGALLIALGFALEAVLYQVADWPQVLAMEHAFTGAGEYPAIILEFWTRFLMWTFGGLLLGAAFYRSDGVGWLTILAAAIPVIAVETTLTQFPPAAPVLNWLNISPADAVSLPTALITFGIGLAVILVMAWMAIKDIPLRNKSA